MMKLAFKASAVLCLMCLLIPVVSFSRSHEQDTIPPTKMRMLFCNALPTDDGLFAKLCAAINRRGNKQPKEYRHIFVNTFEAFSRLHSFGSSESGHPFRATLDQFAYSFSEQILRGKEKIDHDLAHEFTKLGEDLAAIREFVDRSYGNLDCNVRTAVEILPASEKIALVCEEMARYFSVPERVPEKSLWENLQEFLNSDGVKKVLFVGYSAFVFSVGFGIASKENLRSAGGQDAYGRPYCKN